MKLLLLVVASFVVGTLGYPGKRSSGCNTICPMFMIEFCGSDGKTYNSNECFLKSQWCREGRVGYEGFSTLHLGKCTGTELSQGTVGHPGKRLSKCNSFCPMYTIEFCGSDGVTYNSNECFLKSRWCNEGRVGYEGFRTLHYGKCTGTELLQGASSKAPAVSSNGS